MADEQQQDPPETEAAGTGWGKVMDGLGIVAGILLVVIVADIWTDGRLISRRLQKRRGEGEDVDRAS